MSALAEQVVSNDLAALIAIARDRWTHQVVEELGEKELVKATWERAESFAIAEGKWTHQVLEELEEEEFVEASWEHEGALVGA
ncbi:MAG: hypothetical protein ABSD13_09305 [Candidatus Korobacteraceae bacterium]|jgi:hypothetical protein